MTKAIAQDVKKLSRRAATLGFVLALICHLVPPQYRAVCEVVANICQGRL